MLTFELAVTYADGRTETVTTDQRDRAAFELQYNVAARRSMAEGNENVWRYLAWHALKRTKRTASSWGVWSEEAVDVDFTDDEEGSDADPGQPTAPDTSS